MAQKYIKYFPKPLLDDLVSGRWLPVIGAGMSLNAKVPRGKKMPLWGDLGRALGAELPDFQATSTLDAISAYEHEYRRVRLIERLSALLLIGDAQPGEAHKAFCSIPFDIVCTTNFDFLLERQYDATPRFVYPVVDEDQLSVSGSGAGTLLLKLHGDLNHPDRLVVTEDDYDKFLARYPLLATYLSNQLITKTAVFFGYSLDDPDFRQIWSVVTDRLGRTRRMAYTVMVGARQSDFARFERRGVKVISLPGSKDRYGEILAEAFYELRDYTRDNVIAVSQVTEEEPLRELLLPRDATTRLCFFSIPIELVSLYRSRIFPLVEEIGFVPITADDVISPGDNISAKIDAIIDRASVMVVELSSAWTRAEYEIAVASRRDDADGRPNRRELKIIIVATEDEGIPSSALGYPMILRPSLLDERVEEFVEALGAVLRDIAEGVIVGQGWEPQRLLAAREYRAAVISAMTLLEAWLRRSLEKPVWTNVRRPASLRQLIDSATEQGLLNPRAHKRLLNWTRVRNEAVHTDRPINRTMAREIVEEIAMIVRS